MRLFMVFAVGFLVLSQNISAEGKQNVAVTTSLLGSIVSNIGKGEVEVVTICSGSMCPGHFDIGADDIIRLGSARLLVKHGWENFFESLYGRIDGVKPAVFSLDSEKNGMAPDIYVEWTEKIAEALSAEFPESREGFEAARDAYVKKINKKLDDLAVNIRKLKGIKAVCSEKLAGFLQWIGMEVVASYGRPEDFTVKKISGIIDKASEQKAEIIVDNLQSGADAGKFLTRELPGVKQVNISNFPLGTGKDAYLMTLEKNIEKILGALK